MNQPTFTPDPVLKVLMDLNLTDMEMEFRGTLQNTARNPDQPTHRDLVLATVAVLMQRGGQAWPVILCALNVLRERTDEQLQAGDTVAIVNGDRLILPGPEDRTVRQFDINTMREIGEVDVPSLVMTIYSLAGTWKMLERSVNR